jgi:hypothetical protein
MRRLARQGELDAWYARADAASLFEELRAAHDASGAQGMERAARRARENDSAHALAKLTTLVDGKPRIARSRR